MVYWGRFFFCVSVGGVFVMVDYYCGVVVDYWIGGIMVWIVWNCDGSWIGLGVVFWC